jgi:hypothetical protein
MPKVYLTKKWILDWQSSDKSVTMALHSSVSLEMSKISMSAMPVSSTIKKPPQQVFPRIAGILPAAILSSHEMWNKHDVLRQRAQSHCWLLAARVVCFRDFNAGGSHWRTRPPSSCMTLHFALVSWHVQCYVDLVRGNYSLSSSKTRRRPDVKKSRRPKLALHGTTRTTHAWEQCNDSMSLTHASTQQLEHDGGATSDTPPLWS